MGGVSEAEGGHHHPSPEPKIRTGAKRVGVGAEKTRKIQENPLVLQDFPNFKKVS